MQSTDLDPCSSFKPTACAHHSAQCKSGGVLTLTSDPTDWKDNQFHTFCHQKWIQQFRNIARVWNLGRVKESIILYRRFIHVSSFTITRFICHFRIEDEVTMSLINPSSDQPLDLSNSKIKCLL